MQICMMNYGELSTDGKTTYLRCYGVGGGNGLMAYARIDVRGMPDFSQCGKDTEERKRAEKRRTLQVLRKRTENTE